MDQSTRRSRNTHGSISLLAREIVSAAAGAGAMYLIDPDRGRGRRASAHDQIARVLSDIQGSIQNTIRLSRDKLQGVAAESRHLFEHDEASDYVLEQRIRAQIGRAVSAPRAIVVKCNQGEVTVQGPVFADEEARLILFIRRTRGVRKVLNLLEPHHSAEGIPALQGALERTRSVGRRMPIERIGLGLLGILLTSVGLKTRGTRGVVMVAGGAALSLTVFSRLGSNRLGRAPRAIQIRKVLRINAPVGVVFNFWSKFENFPKFTSHLKEVQSLGNGRSRWIAQTPTGVTAEWDAVTTKFEENRAIAWRSESGFALQTTGIVTFRGTENGTEVDVRIVFRPVAGAVGVAVLSLLGPDFKQALDHDLTQLKHHLEESENTKKPVKVRYTLESDQDQKESEFH